MIRENVYNWVLRTILSCETIEQIVNCRNLIKRYFIVYDSDDNLFHKWLEKHNSIKYGEQYDTVINYRR